MTRGQRIQKLRTDAGLSQEAFASMLGVSRQSVSKWEADKAFPETDKLVIITEKFGVSCDWIIMGETVLEAQEEAPAKEENKNLITLPRTSYLTLLVTCAIMCVLSLSLCAYLLYTML